MMDEAEKYQQRLQAIAEKRRLQEEEERAKRDMEDERLRLQQLKRKSLRDQWLMEGPPLSPTSSEGSQGPRSPGWGSHGQEIEKNIDKLQTETQRLAEEEEKLKEQMEDGQTEPIEETEEVTTEAVQEAVVQNGQEETTGSDLAEDEMKTLSPLLDGPAAVITNGRGGEEEEAEDEGNHVASEESPPPPPTTNGLAAPPPEGTVTMTFLGYTEAESDRAPDEAAEEGTLVMRAERVIITDEGDEVTYDVTSQGEQGEEEEVGEGSEEEAAPQLQSSESTQEGGEEAVGELAEVEAVPHQASTEPENATEITEAASSSSAAEIDSVAADGEMGDSETHQNGAVEITTDGKEKSEAPASDSPPASADTPDDAAVASVPVYSESQPSPDGAAVRAEAEGEETTEEPTAQPGGKEESDVAVQEDPTPEEEEAEAGSVPHVPAAAAVPEGQFQDVSLADPQESPIRTDAGEQPGEQEPLLSQTKAPEITRAELPAAAASSPPAAAAASYTETHIPARANQGGEEAAAPKSKTCQCCSVM